MYAAAGIPGKSCGGLTRLSSGISGKLYESLKPRGGPLKRTKECGSSVVSPDTAKNRPVAKRSVPRGRRLNFGDSSSTECENYSFMKIFFFKHSYNIKIVFIILLVDDHACCQLTCLYIDTLIKTAA